MAIRVLSCSGDPKPSQRKSSSSYRSSVRGQRRIDGSQNTLGQRPLNAESDQLLPLRRDAREFGMNGRIVRLWHSFHRIPQENVLELCLGLLFRSL